MTAYFCNDGNAPIEIEADSPEEAAREYVDGGDWGEGAKTKWIRVWVTELDDRGVEIEDTRDSQTVALDPDEPDCVDGEEHDWVRPYVLVGGLEENPGVWGHGGGVQTTSVCRRCGAYRHGDSWAQDPETGEQGLCSVEYGQADEVSLAWVAEIEDCDQIAEISATE